MYTETPRPARPLLFRDAWEAYNFHAALGYGIRDVAAMIQNGQIQVVPFPVPIPTNGLALARFN